jgi:hypothetical protein
MGYLQLTAEERFFFDHAGYSYDPKTETKRAGRIRCATTLARAEIEAERRGWFTEWSDDMDERGCYETCDREGEHTHEVLCAVLYDGDDSRQNGRGRVLASLGGIYDPDKLYARVVAAELAAEALAEHEARTNAPAWFTTMP